jgi:hypothetical protein
MLIREVEELSERRKEIMAPFYSPREGVHREEERSTECCRPSPVIGARGLTSETPCGSSSSLTCLLF